jgi:hypothetical protein
MSFPRSSKQKKLRLTPTWLSSLISGGGLIVFINVLLLILSSDWTTRLFSILFIIVGILIIYAGYRSLQKFKTKYDTYKIWHGVGPDFSKKNK